MSEIDATELARLREKYDTDSQVDVEVRALIDALEKARGRICELDALVESYDEAEDQLISERDRLIVESRLCQRAAAPVARKANRVTLAENALDRLGEL